MELDSRLVAQSMNEKETRRTRETRVNRMRDTRYSSRVIMPLDYRAVRHPIANACLDEDPRSASHLISSDLISRESCLLLPLANNELRERYVRIGEICRRRRPCRSSQPVDRGNSVSMYLECHLASRNAARDLSRSR